MRKALKLSLVAIVLISAAASVVLVTLFSPTPAPGTKSLDYLKIVRALSGLQNRVEAQLAVAAAPSRLVETEKQEAIELSDGLIRDVRLRADGAISVDAVIRDDIRRSGRQVSLLLLPEGGKDTYEWRCLGSPAEALPNFCRPLK